MRLLWLQDLVNVFPGLREVLYSELDRLNQLIQQYLPVQQEAQIWAFPGGVWEEAVRSLGRACLQQAGGKTRWLDEKPLFQTPASMSQLKIVSVSFKQSHFASRLSVQ